MSDRKRKISISLIIAVAVAVAAIFLCAFALRGHRDIAFADSVPSFIISTDDGYNWTLLLDGETIESFEGKFSNPPFTDAASVVFESKIKNVLAQRGEDDYELSFKLPTIDKTVRGSTAFAYTREDGGFTVIGEYEPVISGDVAELLQYSLDGEVFQTYEYASEKDGGLTFGANVNVGSYSVRMAVFERFVFDGRLYRAARYSSAVACSISKAIPQVPEISKASAVYGTTVGKIAESIYASDGVFRLSEEQTAPEVSGKDAILDVNEEGYAVNFDYIPTSENYETVENVRITVNVAPLSVRIYIGNAFSLVGEPIVADVTYKVVTELVGDDTVDGLGVNLYVHGADKDVPGTYYIFAEFANHNYTPDCRNLDNALLYGGVYTVYETRMSAVAPDGTEFFVYINGGYSDMTLIAENSDGSYEPEGYVKRAGYRLIFRDIYNGERVFPKSDFSVSWQGGATERATHIGVGADGELSYFGEIDGESVTVGKMTDTFIFYTPVDFHTPANAQSYTVAGIALVVLCSVFGTVFIILTIIFFTRRRYFR